MMLTREEMFVQILVFLPVMLRIPKSPKQYQYLTILFCSPFRSAYISCVFYRLSCELLQNILCISMWMSPNKESLIILIIATFYCFAEI